MWERGVPPDATKNARVEQNRYSSKEPVSESAGSWVTGFRSARRKGEEDGLENRYYWHRTSSPHPHTDIPLAADEVSNFEVLNRFFLRHSKLLHYSASIIFLSDINQGGQNMKMFVHINNRGRNMKEDWTFVMHRREGYAVYRNDWIHCCIDSEHSEWATFKSSREFYGG